MLTPTRQDHSRCSAARVNRFSSDVRCLALQFRVTLGSFRVASVGLACVREFLFLALQLRATLLRFTLPHDSQPLKSLRYRCSARRSEGLRTCGPKRIRYVLSTTLRRTPSKRIWVDKRGVTFEDMSMIDRLPYDIPGPRRRKMSLAFKYRNPLCGIYAHILHSWGSSRRVKVRGVEDQGGKPRLAD